MGVDREQKLNRLYLSIISRYRSYIEEKENLSVAELPTLVTPKSPLVSAKALSIRNGFMNYVYGRDFPAAGLKAFESVKQEVEDVALPLEFWLTPDEVLEFGMGDAVDKNILLCSVLVALGNPSAKVFVKIRGGAKKVLVCYEFSTGFYAMDLNLGITEYPGKAEFISGIGVDDDTTAYEFNNQAYSDIF